MTLTNECWPWVVQCHGIPVFIAGPFCEWFGMQLSPLVFETQRTIPTSLRAFVENHFPPIVLLWGTSLHTTKHHHPYYIDSTTVLSENVKQPCLSHHTLYVYCNMFLRSRVFGNFTDKQTCAHFYCEHLYSYTMYFIMHHIIVSWMAT